MPFHIGPVELILLLVLVLILFGAGRLPQVAGGLGKGIRDFRRSLAGKDEGKPSEGEPSSGA